MEKYNKEQFTQIAEKMIDIAKLISTTITLLREYPNDELLLLQLTENGKMLKAEIRRLLAMIKRLK